MLDRRASAGRELAEAGYEDANSTGSVLVGELGVGRRLPRNEVADLDKQFLNSKLGPHRFVRAASTHQTAHSEQADFYRFDDLTYRRGYIEGADGVISRFVEGPAILRKPSLVLVALAFIASRRTSVRRNEDGTGGCGVARMPQKFRVDRRGIGSGAGGRLRLAGGLPPIPPDPGDNPTLVPGFWLGLGMMQTLFSMEHNSIAAMLAAADPDFDEETLRMAAHCISSPALRFLSRHGAVGADVTPLNPEACEDR
ncbi:MAG TPA: hypothetical protein VE888_14240 [Streptosporangiaceae bacterium]|nr:hypothetical protein [Streptosporangiaceae bacterium]